MVNGVAKFGNYLMWFFVENDVVLGYLSPEAINENNFYMNGTYGLGVLLLELINMRHPFADDSSKIDTAKILRRELPPINVQCSDGFKALPSNLMQKTRWKSFGGELTDKLANIEHLSVIQPEQDTR